MKLIMPLILLSVVLTSCQSHQVETKWNQAYNELVELRKDYLQSLQKINDKYRDSQDGYSNPTDLATPFSMQDQILTSGNRVINGDKIINTVFSTIKDINEIRKEVFLIEVSKSAETFGEHIFNHTRGSCLSAREIEIKKLQDEYMVKALRLEKKYNP